jgi:hypothetical protein
MHTAREGLVLAACVDSRGRIRKRTRRNENDGVESPPLLRFRGTRPDLCDACLRATFQTLFLLGTTT